MTKTSKKRTKKRKKSKKRKKQYQRGSLIKEIYKMFDEVGIETVTYKETAALAKKVKPDTKFNKYHFSWYKNDYKNRRDIP
jgi:predicted ATPase